MDNSHGPSGVNQDQNQEEDKAQPLSEVMFRLGRPAEPENSERQQEHDGEEHTGLTVRDLEPMSEDEDGNK